MQWSEKLVCNTIHNLKNVLLFFKSELKASYKKGDAGNNPFQCLITYQSRRFVYCCNFQQYCHKNILKRLKLTLLLLKKSLFEKAILKNYGVQNTRSPPGPHLSKETLGLFVYPLKTKENQRFTNCKIFLFSSSCLNLLM